MSNFTQDYRLRFQSETSELAPAIDALERIEALLKEQGKTAQTAARQMSEAVFQQRLDQKAAQQQMVADHRAALQQQTNALKAETDQQTTIVKAEQARQTAALKAELNQQTAAYRAELAQQNAAMRGHTSSLGEAYGTLKNVIIGAFGVHEIYQFTQSVIDAKGTVDIFRGGLTQMLGSKREADALMAEVAKLAVSTPFKVFLRYIDKGLRQTVPFAFRLEMNVL